jgi:hypothetical protein
MNSTSVIREPSQTNDYNFIIIPIIRKLRGIVRFVIIIIIINGRIAHCWAFSNFSVSRSYIFGRISRTGDHFIAKAYTYIGQYKQNKCTQTLMPRVGFKPTLLLFEREKTVHGLVRVATVNGRYCE